MAASIDTPVGSAPVIPVVLIGAGMYLAWFGVHYFGSDTKFPTDPVKAVLQGKPLPAATGQQPAQSVASQLEAQAPIATAAAGTPASSPGTALSSRNSGTLSGLVNPISKGLAGERIDMGVDFGGAGPIYALGDGTITSTFNSGWPGGAFICLHLDSDPSKYVYAAEDIHPLVAVGSHVKAGQVIGYATGGTSGIEYGWAAPPGTGNALAAVSGQAAAGLSQHGDPGAFSTGYGVAMNQLLTSLGAPSGQVHGPVQGTAPPGYS